MRPFPPGVLADWAPPPGKPLIGNNIVFYAAIGAALLGVLLLILWLRRRRPAPVDPERGLRENLADYPPPGPGPRRLLLHGQPLRLRLIVVAPLGKRALPDASAMEPLFNDVLRGLSDIVRQDRPTIRVWPAQLSQQGFAPTFFRLSQRPEPAGKPSRWVLVAGPARAGGQPVVLGLALCADEMNNLGNVSLQARDWSEVFRVGARE